MKYLIIDRDGVINVNSKDPTTDYYYILKPEHLILKEGVKDAFERIASFKRKYSDELSVILATRQKCISKGLITREEVEGIIDHMCTMLDFTFDRVYIQGQGDDKSDTFEQILGCYQSDPSDFVLIDDSSAERSAAGEIGISSIWIGDDGREPNLGDSVEKAFPQLFPVHTTT